MTRFFLSVVLTLTVIIAALAGGKWWIEQYAQTPGPLASEKLLVINEGSGTRAIASSLAINGVIDSPPYAFVILVKLHEKKLLAGEYMFPPGMTPAAVLEKLSKGETYVRKITIPEGSSSREAMAIIKNAYGLSGEVPELEKEGEILPETYYYRYGDKAVALVERMKKDLRNTISENWNFRKSGLPFSTPEEALTLASIIEKETGVPEERGRIAAVFINRLKKGMKLQSDPTAVFAITEGKSELGRKITPEDLKTPSPYNTYYATGLPPGPITNPGRASIEAALNPAESEEFYFVASGNGGHNFAKTLEEHNRNVKLLIEARRERP